MSHRLVILVVAAGCAASTPRHPVPTAQLDDLDDAARSQAATARASEHVCPRVVHPRLWRVERDGRTSYLYGTYHVGVPADRLPDVVIDAFLAADTIAFESIDDPIDDPTRGTLPDVLEPDIRARLAALLGGDYAPLIDAAGATDMIVLLSTQFLDNTAMLDDELERAADRLGKPTVGLEDSDALAPPIARWLGVQTLRAVVLASRGERALRATAMRSLADYCAGRDRADDSVIDADYLGFGLTRADLVQMQDDLVLARNRAWLARLEPLMAAGGAFVAVGAAHLRGPGSVVELLRDRGFQVTRVKAR
jgi:uncharacterized protein YbaP (TraB family)